MQIVVLFGFVIFVILTIGTNHGKQIIFDGASHAHASLFSHVCDRACVLAQINSSAYNLAWNLGLSNGKYLQSISKIENKVWLLIPSMFKSLMNEDFPLM